MNLYRIEYLDGSTELRTATDISPPFYADTPNKWTIHHGEQLEYVANIKTVQLIGDTAEDPLNYLDDAADDLAGTGISGEKWL